MLTNKAVKQYFVCHLHHLNDLENNAWAGSIYYQTYYIAYEPISYFGLHNSNITHLYSPTRRNKGYFID